MKTIDRRYTIFLTMLFMACLAMATMLVPGGQVTQAQPQGQQGGAMQAQVKPQSVRPESPAGSAFTYQGQFKDGGTPANGQYDLQFTLFDAASSGNQVGSTVEVLNQTVTDGLFTVQLDFGTSAFPGDARWLEIAARVAGGGSYTTLSPRQLLSPAPYAASLMPGAVISGTVSSPALTITNTDGVGVQGYSQNTYGIWGQTDYGFAAVAGNHTSQGIGVYGNSGGVGVYGNSSNGLGVYGISYFGDGVRGSSSDAYGGRFVTGNFLAAGVYGSNTAIGGVGVYGEVLYGASAYAVWGHTNSGTGVFGESNTGNGLYGRNNSGSAYGVQGYGGIGVKGDASVLNGVGVRGDSYSGYGVHGVSLNPSGYAGYFDGRVQITGNLSKGGGSFKIDHPLDPADKYLYHSFVESPDMMNVYNGNVTLNAKGEAWVQLPDWFEALNKEFRYQLTAIGAPGPNLYVAEKVKDNRFKIAGGTPAMEVSWQVTGIRHDPYANAHRIPVEENKPSGENGLYLYPKEYGQPESKGINYERNQQVQQQMKQHNTRDDSRVPGR
jgi:hypothetical protein